jgi:hypothetical protein
LSFTTNFRVQVFWWLKQLPRRHQNTKDADYTERMIFHLNLQQL